jgi:hypothetical protein
MHSELSTLDLMIRFTYFMLAQLVEAAGISYKFMRTLTPFHADPVEKGHFLSLSQTPGPAVPPMQMLNIIRRGSELISAA